MFEPTSKPIREHLRDRLAALAALQAATSLRRHESGTPPGDAASADYQVVLHHLELEATQAIAAAAAELKKPTVGTLIDRLWESGPLTFKQIRAAVVEADAPPGHIETLLNRLHNAGLLAASPGPTAATNAIQQDAVTLSPVNRLGAEPTSEITRPIPTVSGSPREDVRSEGDVTLTYSSLNTSKGRDWFNGQAKAQGIDLGERINCQF